MLPALALALFARQTPTDITVPVHLFPVINIPWVEARISGKVFRFALDTGSPYPLIVSDATARRLGIDLAASPVLVAGELKGHSVKIPGMDIAGQPVGANFTADEPVAALDLGDMSLGERPLDGIIGLPLLAKLKTEFDYEAGRVVFHLGSLGPVWASAKAVPYVERDGAWFVDVGFLGGKASMSFDTGRGSTLIGTADAELLKASASRLARFSDLYGTETGELLYSASASLAGAQVGPVAVQTRKRGSLLGNDVLRCFRFVLDPDHKCVLMIADPRIKPLLPSYDVVSLTSESGRFMIQTGPDTPMGADLRTGDELGEIDGNAVVGLDDPSISAVLQGKTGTSARLVLLRDGKRIEVTYRRPSAFDYLDDPARGRSGIAEAKPQADGTLQILAMRTDRPLWTAGVRPGDVVTEIDGKPLKGLPATEVSMLASKGLKDGAVLTIKRGEAAPRKVKLDPI